MAADERNAAGLTAEQIATVQARRQHIRDTARCEGCGAPLKVCEAQRGKDPTAPPWFGCCARGILGDMPCRHRESVDDLRQLADEILAGHIRTVAEVDPPPVLGPNLPSMTWLLEQTEWWYPHRRPAVRVAEMDKPHRWNLARWLERKAPALESRDRWRGVWADAPDDVWADLARRTPQDFLDESPLYQALTKGLPKVGSKAGGRLAARAVHWSTCPMRLKFPGARDRCVCIRDGAGKIVGAASDPATRNS